MSRSPLLSVTKRGREFATLFRGEFASVASGAYSIFPRKRDAEALADFLDDLFGHERLVAMENDPCARPTREERDAIHQKIAALQS